MTVRDIAVAFGFEVDKSSEKHAESSIKGIKNLATKLLGSIAVVFSVKGIADFAKDCVGVASDVEEMQNKFDVVFQGMTDEVENWAQTFADSIGRNKNDIKGYLADNQNMFVGMGMTREAAAGLSEDLVSLSLDLASFNNLQEDQAVNAMSKAIMGESESAKTLGAVLNDNTRAMAMQEMGLSGTYQALDEATKMQVNYTAILMQSSDAVGDCARSLDSYKGRQIQLNSSIAELKEFIGGQLLPVFAIFLGYINSGVKALTAFAKKVLGATQEENRLLNAFNRVHAVVKRLQPAIDRMMQTLSNGAKKGIDFVKGIVDKLGGIENALKLLALVAGAFVIAMNWTKIMKGAKALLSMIKVIGRLLSPSSLHIFALIAAITILALIVEDFINFMMGNDSVIGLCFEKAGIDADKMREKIKNIWDNLKSFFAGIWNAIKAAAQPILESIKEMLSNIFGEDLFAGLGEGVAGIIEFLERITKALAQNKGLQDFLGKATVGILAVITAIKIAIPIVQGVIAIIGIVKGAIAAVGAVIGFLTSPIGLVIAAIVALISIGVLLYKNWDKIKQFASDVWNKVSAAFNAGIEKVKAFMSGVIDFIKSNWQSLLLLIVNPFAGAFKLLYDNCEGFRNFVNQFLEKIKAAWEAVWNGIKSFFEGIWNGIVSFISGIWSGITGLFSSALNGIVALWQAIWGAVSSFFSGIWNGIVSFITGIWASITGIISGAINNAYNTISSVLTAIMSFFSNIFSSIASTVSSTFSNILSGVTSAVGSIKDAIVNGFNQAISFITSLPSQAIQWGKDFIGGLKDGIMSGVQGIVDAVKGIGDKIKSFLHFSVPDEGPLTDYESWMPDFMGGLAKGISDNENTVLDKVKGLAGGISALTQAAVATPATATTSTVNNSTSSVVQNNNFNNSFTGGTAETQKNVSKAMKKSAYDATSYMAKGLSYARG